jgi:hypothetical protein
VNIHLHCFQLLGGELAFRQACDAWH